MTARTQTTATRARAYSDTLNNCTSSSSSSSRMNSKKSVRFCHDSDDNKNSVNVTIYELPRERFQLLARHQQQQRKKLLWWTDDELRTIWNRSFQELDSIMKVMKKEEEEEQERNVDNYLLDEENNGEDDISDSGKSSVFQNMIKFSFLTWSSYNKEERITARGLERFYQDTNDESVKKKHTKKAIHCILRLQELQQQTEEEEGIGADGIATATTTAAAVPPTSSTKAEKYQTRYKKLSKRSTKFALEYGKLDAMAVQDYLKTTHEELLHEQQRQVQEQSKNVTSAASPTSPTRNLLLLKWPSVVGQAALLSKRSNMQQVGVL